MKNRRDEMTSPWVCVVREDQRKQERSKKKEEKEGERVSL